MLIRQCCEISEVVGARDGETGDRKSIGGIVSVRPTTPKGRPLSAAQKEQGWLQQIVVGCWTTLLADAAKGMKEQLGQGAAAAGSKSPTTEAAAAFHRRSSTV